MIRKNDWKWLRASSLQHDGFPDGFTWEGCPAAYERLLGMGFVSKHYETAERARAIITAAGRVALRQEGERLLREATLRGARAA